MKFRSVLLSAVIAVAASFPARAEVRTFTIMGHEFKIDVPSDFSACKANTLDCGQITDDQNQGFVGPGKTVLFFVITPDTMSMEDQAKGLPKQEPGWSFELVAGGRVLKRFRPDGSGRAGLYTLACSGSCTLFIFAVGDKDKVHELMDKYENLLADHQFYESPEQIRHGVGN